MAEGATGAGGPAQDPAVADARHADDDPGLPGLVGDGTRLAGRYRLEGPAERAEWIIGVESHR